MKYAREQNVQISTIGIGKTDGTPLFVTDSLTGKKQYFTDDTGKPIIASIDEKSLKTIAETTGGKFFLASDNGTLEKVFQTLSSLKKTTIQTKTTTTHEPLANNLTLIFLILFSILAYYKIRVVS
jgi:Ca-activated chloride channel family protein